MRVSVAARPQPAIAIIAVAITAIVVQLRSGGCVPTEFISQTTTP
jgi:hypothetical protein